MKILGGDATVCTARAGQHDQFLLCPFSANRLRMVFEQAANPRRQLQQQSPTVPTKTAVAAKGLALLPNARSYPSSTNSSRSSSNDDSSKQQLQPTTKQESDLYQTVSPFHETGQRLLSALQHRYRKPVTGRRGSSKSRRQSLVTTASAVSASERCLYPETPPPPLAVKATTPGSRLHQQRRGVVDSLTKQKLRQQQQLMQYREQEGLGIPSPAKNTHIVVEDQPLQDTPPPPSAAIHDFHQVPTMIAIPEGVICDDVVSELSLDDALTVAIHADKLGDFSKHHLNTSGASNVAAVSIRGSMYSSTFLPVAASDDWPSDEEEGQQEEEEGSSASLERRQSESVEILRQSPVVSRESDEKQHRMSAVSLCTGIHHDQHLVDEDSFLTKSEQTGEDQFAAAPTPVVSNIRHQNARSQSWSSMFARSFVMPDLAAGGDDLEEEVLSVVSKNGHSKTIHQVLNSSDVRISSGLEFWSQHELGLTKGATGEVVVVAARDDDEQYYNGSSLSFSGSRVTHDDDATEFDDMTSFQLDYYSPTMAQF